MVDTVLTLAVTVLFALAALNGIVASLYELRSSRRDGQLLSQLKVNDARREVVRAEWWRHAVRLVGFSAFGLVAVVMVTTYDLSVDVSAGRMVVRLLLVIGLGAMTLVTYLDRRARKRLMAESRKPAVGGHPRRRHDD